MPEEAIQRLMNSIRTIGLKDRSKFRYKPSSAGIYQQLTGSLRLEAVRRLGWKTVPGTIIHDCTDEQAREFWYADNIHEDLGAIDEAEFFLDEKKQTGLTNVKIGEKYGFDEQYIDKRIKLTQLCDEVKTMVDKGELYPTHAYHIAVAFENNPELQRESAKKAEIFTIKELKEAIKAFKTGEPYPKVPYLNRETKPTEKPAISPFRPDKPIPKIDVRPVCIDGKWFYSNEEANKYMEEKEAKKKEKQKEMDEETAKVKKKIKETERQQREEQTKLKSIRKLFDDINELKKYCLTFCGYKECNMKFCQKKDIIHRLINAYYLNNIPPELTNLARR